jgi:iron complex outermembrane recepter protein
LFADPSLIDFLRKFIIYGVRMRFSSRRQSRSQLGFLILGLFPVGLVLPVQANQPPTLNELTQNSPATTVTEWQERLAQAIVQVTGVQLQTTEAGLNLVLETSGGELPSPTPRVVGNALIADISNAALSDEFQQANPAEGIALVSVTSLPGDRVRVAITGTDSPPIAQISTAPTGLAFAVTTGNESAATEEAIEIVVTGEQEEGYAVGRSSVGTRTDATGD